VFSTNLIWDHQKRNAALAYEICTYLWVSEDIILWWLQEVIYKWRLEYIKNNLLIDWAHNEQWLEILQNYLLQIKDTYKKIVYCFSVKKGKEIKKLIVDKFWEDKEYIIVDQQHYQLTKMEDCVQQMSWMHYQVKAPREIIALAEKNKHVLYVVFWSLYMIGWFYL
jgi:folylpolyglutamate synthase/dihydropteroate synthase